MIRHFKNKYMIKMCINYFSKVVSGYSKVSPELTTEPLPNFRAKSTYINIYI